MIAKVFKPGDIIMLKNKEYLVIQNYGIKGLVKETCKDGAIIKGFSWIQEDEESKFVRVGDKENDIVNSVNREYVEFFEKYEI